MIAIKNMKNIPNRCAECGLKSGGYCYHKKPPYNLSEFELLNEKSKDCPLVEIVTCKDCKYYFIDEDGHGYHCEGRDTERMPTCADWYCIHAERRE